MSDAKVINIEVVKGREDIHVNEGGSISIDGPAGINLYRLYTLKSGMEFESKTGMKLTRGPSCFTIVKREYGFKGNKAKVYDQFCTHYGFEKKPLGDK